MAAMTMPVFGPVSVAGAEPLRFGVTAEQLRRIAMWSATRYGPTLGLDLGDRFEAAWGAMVEALYSAATPVSDNDLFFAAKHGLSRLSRADMHDRGFPQENPAAAPGSAPGFARYWTPMAYDTPEAKVVDAVALGQIMAALRPSFRRALLALAEHGDYPEAAEALGIALPSYYSLVREARLAFFRLWHQGEAPSGVWHTFAFKKPVRTIRPRCAAVLAEPDGIALTLADVLAVFDAAGTGRMRSAHVVEALAAAHPGRYGDWDQRDLAFVLKRAGVPTQRSMSFGSRTDGSHSTFYGYKAEWVQDALADLTGMGSAPAGQDAPVLAGVAA